MARAEAGNRARPQARKQRRKPAKKRKKLPFRPAAAQQWGFAARSPPSISPASRRFERVRLSGQYRQTGAEGATLEPEPTFRELLPWQIPADEWAKDRDRVAFFLHKRLGKCTLALRWAIARQANHTLIVAPLSACPGWMDEIAADMLKGVLLYGTRSERESLILWGDSQFAAQPTFYVTNPQGLFLPAGRREQCPKCKGEGGWPLLPPSDKERIVRCNKCMGEGVIKMVQPAPTELALLPWDAVIWDESVSLANPRSQTNKIARGCFYDVPRRAILSGEPAPEGEQQLFEQFAWLMGRFMGHARFWHWRDENFDQIGYDWIPKPGRLGLIKKAVAANSYRMTRRQAGIGEVKTFESRWTTLPPKVRESYTSMENNFEFGNHSTKYVLPMRMWLARAAGGVFPGEPKLCSDHKLNVLEELLLGEFGKEPVVVLFRFNAELSAAYKRLREHPVTKSCAMVTGEDTPEQRAAKRLYFQKGRTRVLLMQIKVATYGLDLSAADVMIRFSLPDSYNEISQSMDRIIHPLKKQPLAYVDIVAKDTVDEDRYFALGDKAITANYFMSAVQDNMKKRIQHRKGAS